ncbi:peptidoglycan-binding protein [Thiocystis violacea]|uniref:peptidoglycan-binding protein n=1 Tax=Thiocystis violacea TaxID=13725 RepID=UPI0030B873DC
MDVSPLESPLAAYRALSASQSRNYDNKQDISPRQMLILLEVCERTGASLGQTLATGEHESARTWNDHVRPTLNNGRLGSATGVWQFMPATFHHIVKQFGTRLLAASEADPAAGRERLDLGDGPFPDAEVRRLIQETADGRRDADDGELQLLRHNFAVLAFAKHYLSVDSGANTPEEDYLYHFLGAGEGRRVLALARGEARDTLSVKPVAPVDPVDPVDPPAPVADPPPMLAAIDQPENRVEVTSRLRAGSLSAIEPRYQPRIGSPLQPRVSVQWGLASNLQRPAFDPAIATMEPRRVYLGAPSVPSEPAIWSQPAAPEIPPPVSSQWGFPADSAVVTGNLGMFYRDGKGQTQPYTWAEFMEHLARRVRAKDQPALTRAKYGVGFELKGGDMPERAFNPEKVSKAAEFRHEISGAVLVPEALVTGPLGPDETRRYKRRLAELVNQGADQPLDRLPPETLSALHHLSVLSPDIQEPSTAHPEVSTALSQFRKLVGKQAPDDPAHRDRLMPAERIALEIYDQRLARYAALQAGQQASLGEAADLSRVRTMPAGLRKAAAPHVSVLQTELAARGFLKPLTRKVVWRDKRRKKHVSYETIPFPGYAGKATLAAIESFQWRNGLRTTQGVADAVTLAMLGLPPMGQEIFSPMSGPYCAIDEGTDPAPACELPTSDSRHQIGHVIPIWSRSLVSLPPALPRRLDIGITTETELVGLLSVLGLEIVFLL